MRAIAGSHNPQCQLWIFVEFKSFNSSPVKNPCPVYLQAKHSALNADGGRAATCFMWEPRRGEGVYRDDECGSGTL